MFTRKIFRTIHNIVKLKQVRYKSTVMTDEKFAIPKRFVGSDYSVWVEYVQLAAEYNPVNLGQGFPNYPPPSHVTNSLSDIGSPENFMLNQYTRGYGHPNLVKALSQFYSQLIGRQINQNTEILVTIGAYEALYCSIQGHVEMGDEVIIMEPFYDCYEPMVKTAGGVCKFIPLRPTKTEGTILSSDWKLDTAELEALFSTKTKIIILNTPHNPIGKVFDREELTLIADLCKKWNVLCISDEVYEWIVYPPNEHIRIATLPDMWERTITIGSAGKTFSVTGWKTGWAYGPANLLRNLQVIHQNCVYTCCTPIQEATARGFGVEMGLFGTDESYFKTLPLELVAKRDFMAKFLKDIGMNPTIPQGGYFMIADWSKLADKVDLSKELDEYKDYKFTKWMTKSVGLQGIPPTAFYSKNKCLAEDLVRYCFFKTDETLQEACQILGKWKESW